MAPSSWEIERILCHLQETQALVKYKVIIATHLFHSQHCDCLEQCNMEFSQRRTLREFLNYKAEFITHATITFWSCRTENTILVNTTFALAGLVLTFLTRFSLFQAALLNPVTSSGLRTVCRKATVTISFSPWHLTAPLIPQYLVHH